MLFEDAPNLKHRVDIIVPTPDIVISHQFLSDVELIAEAGGSMFWDIECYPNYFIVVFKSAQSGKIVKFEESPNESINVSKLGWMLVNFTIIGFNSNNYDCPIVCLALRGWKAQALYAASINLICGMALRDFCKEYVIKLDVFNSIDLIEVVPLKGSLKLYTGRIHCQRMQSLPYDPHEHLSELQAKAVFRYCCNDLDNTELLHTELKPHLALREKMSAEYGIDLRSKSDAQVAEHCICAGVKQINGRYPKKPEIDWLATWKYQIPKCLSYTSPVFNNLLKIVGDVDFALTDQGKIDLPTELKGLKLNLGYYGVYRLGIGGLHSSEQSIKHIADADTLLIDTDVKSYYPAIILSQELYPKHMGKAFLKVYHDIVTRRLHAKDIGDELTSSCLKIAINGSFGKFGSMYSRLFSPEFLIQITLTGQLCLLMLIDMLESAGISVISANTDGVILKCPNSAYTVAQRIVKDWERRTTFEMEESRYSAIYSRDVNNYIAVKADGKLKVKGVYSELGSALNSRLSKNPEHYICSLAVQNFLAEGTSIEETIRGCKDFTKFVTVRNVVGGAHKDGVYLGKTIRWYYTKDVYGHISYVLSGNKVPLTDGAKPVMDLPKEMPTDISYDWYLNEAQAILMDVGYLTPRTLFN